ncbi:hypothetical protein PR001_g4206 [Phytophthora rubi]|uniref:Uncharacterized protein n=1 Tax=Phytophthora rubi TaxID=129364 RepID=A0A6A3NVZ9_9STRA|nr:hypothetical protein PR001_g4206 [Phytophthora rubi]
MCGASEHSTYSPDSSSAPWVDSKYSTYLPDPSSVPWVDSKHSTYLPDPPSAPWVDSKHSTYLPDPSSAPCCALRGKFSTERSLRLVARPTAHPTLTRQLQCHSSGVGESLTAGSLCQPSCVPPVLAHPLIRPVSRHAHFAAIVHPPASHLRQSASSVWAAARCHPVTSSCVNGCFDV